MVRLLNVLAIDLDQTSVLMKKLWLILAISAWIFIFLPLVLVWQEVIHVAESYQLMAVGALLWIVSRWGLRQSKKGSGKR